MKEYLDKKFAVIAIKAGDPYVIIGVLLVCLSGILAIEREWLDLSISIGTLILDQIIISQGNKTSKSNQHTLDAILRLEKQHSKNLEELHNRFDRLGNQPRGNNGRFTSKTDR